MIPVGGASWRKCAANGNCCERGANKGERMKVQASVKKRCDSCKIIKRRGIIRVICSKDPTHKQRQG